MQIVDDDDLYIYTTLENYKVGNDYFLQINRIRNAWKRIYWEKVKQIVFKTFRIFLATFKSTFLAKHTNHLHIPVFYKYYFYKWSIIKIKEKKRRLCNDVDTIVGLLHVLMKTGIKLAMESYFKTRLRCTYNTTY